MIPGRASDPPRLAGGWEHAVDADTGGSSPPPRYVAAAGADSGDCGAAASCGAPLPRAARQARDRHRARSWLVACIAVLPSGRTVVIATDSSFDAALRFPPPVTFVPRFSARLQLTEEDALALFEETKRFLCVASTPEQAVPSDAIDQAGMNACSVREPTPIFCGLVGERRVRAPSTREWRQLG